MFRRLLHLVAIKGLERAPNEVDRRRHGRTLQAIGEFLQLLEGDLGSFGLRIEHVDQGNFVLVVLNELSPRGDYPTSLVKVHYSTRHQQGVLVDLINDAVVIGTDF